MDKAIAAFDIGGSAVKYGVWYQEKLTDQGSFPLPETWRGMKADLQQTVETMKKSYPISGAAFSAPGLVDAKDGVIRGITAVPYIHEHPFRQELEEQLGLPISMENDANCAALGEYWQGAAKGHRDSIFFVIGTGIGGAIILDGRLVRGRNLFGGEFGYAFLDENCTLSQLGSAVKTVEKYNELNHSEISGADFFAATDPLAEELSGRFYRSIARGIYNLLVALDPGLVILGGGVSANEHVVTEIRRHVAMLMAQQGVKDMDYQILPCAFKNDANLMGAVFDFLSNQAGA